jgi:hypothetical protein
MKNLLLALIAAIVLMAAGLYYNFLYPPSVMRKNTEAALQSIASVVETQDRAKLSDAIAQFLSADAKIHLDVSFSSISQANARAMSQDFDKQSFIAFIDNVLMPLTDYHYYPKLQTFLLNENKIAAVQFTSGQRADGPSFYSGVALTMRFSGDAQCQGEVVFQEQQPKLRQASCNVLLRSVTKSDSAGAMVDKAQEIHNLLNQPQR